MKATVPATDCIRGVSGEWVVVRVLMPIPYFLRELNEGNNRHASRVSERAPGRDDKTRDFKHGRSENSRRHSKTSSNDEMENKRLQPLDVFSAMSGDTV